METIAALTDFQASVQASCRDLEQLLEVLQAEREALAGTDPRGVERQLSPKLELLQALETAQLSRDRRLRELGLPAGPEGTERLWQAPGIAPGLRADWERLTHLLHQAQADNTLNSQLAQQRELTARAALQMLTGRSGDEPRYGRAGRRRGGSYSNSLAKA